MNSSAFVHLHNHTEYSMLDGAAKIAPMLAEAQRLEMPAIGMTDHGNMFGASEFYNLATEAGIKPIIGVEAYIAPGSRFDTRRILWGDPGQKADDVSGSGSYTHLTMVAENATGVRNLFKLSSLASFEGQLGKWSRMDAEIVAENAAGIIATTGCPSGEVQTRLRLGHDREALESAARWREIFGPDNYFLELMDHGLQIERRVRDGLLEIGRKLDIPALATNDCHYVTREAAHNHEALLCVQTGKTLSDPNRFKFDGDGYYLKSAAEMRSLWDDEIPGACDSTLLIAERVQSYEDVWAPRDRMPVFPVPDGHDQASWLRHEVDAGLAGRFPAGVPPEYVDRAAFEIEVICAKGYPSYFLIVADLVGYARSVDIRVGPGRGSAAGSLVAYALRITDIDPIEHGLLFERFLNPERASMPDIDIDFDDRRRGEMVRYAADKWGHDRVAQVITFGTIKTKAALKDSARIHYGQPGFAIADRITKALPPAVMAKDIPLSGITDPTHERYKEAAEVRGLIDADPDVRTIYETARGLEGLIRNAGVHACAVIMSSEPLTEAIPLWKRPQDGAIITGWDYPSCEAIGLLKMDFLGLRNLTIIGDALENIQANRGIELDLESVALDDGPTYELLGRGDTLGVFQLDGGPMRDLLRRMQPTGFEDVVAVIALYRPGPMGMNAHNDYADRKNGRQAIRPIHPELAEPLEEILAETYGLIVYQEQIMRIAQKVAGYSLARADILRKAMGKKKREVLDKEYEGFSEGMKANGFSAAAIKALWDTVLPFADYAFNKSHAAGYGLVSYWTGYLKANYPAEYMAGLLTSVGDDKDKAAVYLADCRKLGITVLPPDVNESGLNFASVGEDIRYGLGARAQCRIECRCVADRFADRQGQVHRLLRLSQQDRHRPVQQEGHRVADQVGRVRLARPSAQGPVPGAHRRGRIGAGHQEGRGDGPVRPVRRGRHRHRRGVHHQGARRGVGRQAQAGAGAGDARPVRVRPPAERRCAPADRSGRYADPVDPRRRHPQRRAGTGRRDPDRGEPPRQQERDALGVSAVGGSDRRRRGDVLPAHVLECRCGDRRRRRGAGQRQGANPGRPALPDRQRPCGARLFECRGGPATGGEPADTAVHHRQGHRAQAGARPSPGHITGASATDQR